MIDIERIFYNSGNKDKLYKLIFLLNKDTKITGGSFYRKLELRSAMPDPKIGFGIQTLIDPENMAIYGPYKKN